LIHWEWAGETGAIYSLESRGGNGLTYIHEVYYPRATRGSDLRALAIAVLLSAVALATCVAPAMGQGVTVGYGLYVSFFCPAHWLYNIQITVYDQAGRIVGKGFSPDGSLVLIPVQTETPIIALTTVASGYAAGPLASYWASPAYWPVSGHSIVPVEITGGEYWVTLALS